MQRLSPLDAGFLELDDEHAAVHIGGIAIFAGPAPPQGDIERLYRRALPTMPRFRQRLRSVPFKLDWPVWVDAADFDLTYHLRRAALPAPGGGRELETLVGRIFSQRLDLSRPPWEVWLVEGLAEDRWALVTKMHHSMADGITAMAQFSSLLDAPHRPSRPGRATTEPQPGPARLFGTAVLHRAAMAGRAARALPGYAVRPVRSAGAVVAATRGALSFAAAVRPNTSNSLVGPLDSPRRYRMSAVDLDDIAAMRAGLGGSLNDAVLAIVSRGFRALLLSRHEAPTAHAVRCLVPVSVRGPDGAAEKANRVSGVVVELPVDFADAGSAYGATTARMQAAKASHEVDIADLTVTLAEYLPPALTAHTLHAAFRMPQWALTTVVTNVPGPVAPARMLDHPLLALYPYVPIADRVRIAVAVTTFGDHAFFGITCDRTSVGDADVFTAGIRSGVTDLIRAATAAQQTRT